MNAECWPEVPREECQKRRVERRERLHRRPKEYVPWVDMQAQYLSDVGRSEWEQSASTDRSVQQQNRYIDQQEVHQVAEAEDEGLCDDGEAALELEVLEEKDEGQVEGDALSVCMCVNEHNVPADKLEQMKNRFEIKLWVKLNKQKSQ